jgi:8-oxo-dGTP pyrophosphatase MutT (NUDIX family)
LPHTSKLIYQGRVLQLGIDSLTLPNGKAVELEVLRHPGGAAIVALNRQDQVCLLRQYRHAAGGWLWELPAGKLEADESPQATAERELVEEAGLQAGRWDTLGKVIVSPGFCDEVIHLYLARDLTVVPAQPEEDELFEVHWIAFERALEQVYDGTLLDAKTMLGLTMAAKHIQE